MGKKLITKYDLLKGYFFLFGMPQDGFVSIDTTNKCNLRCKHCYFFEQDVEEHELKADEWYEKLVEMKKDRVIPFLQCTWVGGEPLLRKDLIEKGKTLFKYNTVVTNGSFPIPDWKDVNFYISIDGDEARHDLVRNKPGLYQKIKKTITESPVPVTVAFCINALNQHSVEDCFNEWRQHPNVKNFCFDFYTPIETLSDDLTLSWETRDKLVDRLLALKTQYPQFLAIDREVIELMRSTSCKPVTDNCQFAKKASSFDPSGVRKAKCMLGEKADCERCGCVVPFYMHTLTHKPTVIRNTFHKWFVQPFKRKSLSPPERAS